MEQAPTPSRSEARPLAGLRVVELATAPSGAQVGQFLADYGADVVMVEPPGGSRLRLAPAFPAWGRGKRSVEADLRRPGGRGVLEELLGNADVLVETFRPATRRRYGLEPASLTPAHPALVHASITGFGSQGPLAEMKGYEALVMAKVGGLGAFSGMASRPGPAYVSVPYASWAATQACLHGVLAALYERETSGAGQHVETSLAHAVGALDPWGWMVEWLRMRYPEAFTSAPPVGEDLVPNSSFTFRLLVALTADGRWLQFSQVQPRLFRALMRAMDLEWMYDDARWRSLPEFEDPAQRVEFWELLLEQARARSAAQWQDVFAADHDVWAEVFRHGSELLHHPQLVHNRMVVELPDCDGRAVRQPGPLVRVLAAPEFHATPAPAVGAPAPAPAVGAPATAARPAASTAPPVGRLPIAGVTVLELGTFYAAPFGATLLSDLGARVIKVEPLEGDPMRTILPFPESGGARVLQGKQSVALDMASAAGREIIAELARRSDLVLQCFRAGVAERLGVDAATLQTLNPDLVYLHSPGYGIDGPNGHCPAFAPTMGAGAGFAWRNVGPAVAEGSDLDLDAIKRDSLRLTAAAGPQFAQADGVSAVAVATGLLLGLLGRARGAGAAALMTTMLSSSAHCLSEDMVEYEGRAPLGATDPDFLGLGPLYRLYEAADGWVFLAAPSESEWPVLVGALRAHADLGAPRFATAAGRARHGDELVSVLAAVFAGRPAGDWERELVAAGVGCAAVSLTPPERNFLGPLGREHGYVTDAVHPTFGEHGRLAPLVRFSRSATQAPAGTVLGQHTEAVLREIGMPPERVAALRDAGTILTA